MLITLLLISSIHCLGTLYAMELDKNKDENTPCIVQDIEILKPYYKAISQVRVTLDDIVNKFCYINSGFVDCPRPNSYFYRTPKYIFLKTNLCRGKETLDSLYTPFGEVQLLSSGCDKERREISEKFLKTMEWKLKDVTDQIIIYNYIQEKNKFFGPYAFEKENKQYGYAAKLYIVVSIGTTKFYEGSSQEKLITLGSIICLTNAQDERDQKQFKELSGGKRQF